MAWRDQGLGSVSCRSLQYSLKPVTPGRSYAFIISSSNTWHSFWCLMNSPAGATLTKYYTLGGLRESWVTQMVKKLPAVQETWVWSLGRKDPLEKGKATHFSILAWRIPRTEEAGDYSPGGRKNARHKWACTQVLTPLVAGVRSQAKLQWWLFEPQVALQLNGTLTCFIFVSLVLIFSFSAVNITLYKWC